MRYLKNAVGVISKMNSGWVAFWNAFALIFRLTGFYTVFYFLVGLFAKKKEYDKTETKKRYGIIICARNERLVIGNLIDSINAQTYDKDKMTVFVVADNCTDDTAEICRQKGCVVYERFDEEHARKGYALEFLFDRIREEHGIDNYDGFIVFDADNLLSPTFIEEMNKAFCVNPDIVVGYRNTKNFGKNFISAGYGIHFYKATVRYHRPRSFFGLSTHIAGTGFCISNKYVRDGWHFTCLTEDTQFSLHSIARGEKIAFCEAAEFYDEQPYEIRVMARQRIRWIRGRMFAYFTELFALLKGLLKGGRKGISCLDMLYYGFPGSTFTALHQILFPLLRKTCSLGWAYYSGSAVSAAANVPQEKKNVFMAVWIVSEPLVRYVSREVVENFCTVVRERERINCKNSKLILYTFLSPWFDLIAGPLALAALFSRSVWKPIKHDEIMTLDDVKKNKKQ